MEICRTCLEDVDLPVVGNAKKGTCDICHSTELMVMTTPKEKYKNAQKIMDGEGLDPSLQATVVTTSIVNTMDNGDTVKGGIKSLHENTPNIVNSDPSAVIAYKSRDGKLFLTIDEKNNYEKEVVSNIIAEGIYQHEDVVYISYSALVKAKSFLTLTEVVDRIGNMSMSKWEGDTDDNSNK